MTAAKKIQQARTRKAVTYAVLIALSCVSLVPLLWMVSTALKPIEETMVNPPQWIPTQMMWENFGKAVTYDADKLGFDPMVVYARNTLFVCLLSVLGTVMSNAVVAYSFARLKWPGRDLIFAITLATMMVPFPILMVPLFQQYTEFGWLGTFRPLWVASWFGSAFSIFLLRQFYRTIPFELSEAAKLDGCSEWGIFTQVILPLAKPALAVVALFSFMGTWNDFLGPLLYLQSQDMMTLAVGLRSFQSQAGGTAWNLLMAASTMVILPVVVLFFFTQKTFIQGIATTGLKG
jgi:multiple sugar transport system permease protein